MTFKTGDRIRFRRELTTPACGDHPAFLHASKGESGTVVGPAISSAWDYEVKTDGIYPSFFANQNEIEPYDAATA